MNGRGKEMGAQATLEEIARKERRNSSDRLEKVRMKCKD